MSVDKVVANIVLFIMYAYFFGHQSIKRYIDKAVITTKHSEKPSSIIPPGYYQYNIVIVSKHFADGHFIAALTIFPMNPDQKGSNWKQYDKNLALCLNLTGNKFIDCVEDKSYSISEILPDYSACEVKHFYVSEWWGLAKSVEIEEGAISNNVLSTPFIHLNENITYMIMLTDPKLQLYTASPDVISRSLLTIKQEAGQYHFYVKVDM